MQEVLSEVELHEQLAARFPLGVIWVDCGISLQTSSPQFALSARQKALSLARELQEAGEEVELDHMVLGSALVVGREGGSEGEGCRHDIVRIFGPGELV